MGAFAWMCFRWTWEWDESFISSANIRFSMKIKASALGFYMLN